jgi:hypothetical protein
MTSSVAKSLAQKTHMQSHASLAGSCSWQALICPMAEAMVAAGQVIGVGYGGYGVGIAMC